MWEQENLTFLILHSHEQRMFNGLIIRNNNQDGQFEITGKPPKYDTFGSSDCAGSSDVICIENINPDTYLIIVLRRITMYYI